MKVADMREFPVEHGRETAAFDNFVPRKNNIAEYRGQQFASATDHFAVDKRLGRGVLQPDFETAILPDKTYFEVLVGLKQRASIIRVAIRIQYRQHAAAQQWVQAAGAARLQLVDFELGQYLEAALGPNLGIDKFSGHSGLDFDRRILASH